MGKIHGMALSRDAFIDEYFTYYRDLEKQVIDCRRYLSFSPKNYGAFSVEMLRLLQVICSEIDVFAKQIAIEESPNHEIDENCSIMKWGPAVHSRFPHIESMDFEIINSECTGTPWMKWNFTQSTKQNGYKYADGCESPFWWRTYNKVKHQRAFKDKSGALNYEKATLKCLLYSLAALFLLERTYFKQLSPDERLESQLFKYEE